MRCVLVILLGVSVIGVVCDVAHSRFDPEEPPESPGNLHIGVLHKGILYTSTEKHYKDIVARTLYWTDLAGKEVKSRRPKGGGATREDYWRIAHGRLWWGGTTRIPIGNKTVSDKLYLFRLNDFLKGKESQGPDSSPSTEAHKSQLVELRNGLDSLQSYRRTIATFANSGSLKLSVVPLSEDSMRVFIATTVTKELNLKPALHILYYKPSWWAKERRWKVDGSKSRKEEVIPLPAAGEELCTEPFHAFQRGTTYYFVTDSGKVYAAPKPAKGPRKFVTIHADKKRPVVAVLTDDKAKRTFVFCEAPKSTKGVLLELVDKARPIAYDRAKVPPVKLKEPLRRVLEYTRVLQANKLLKAK